MNKKIEAEKGIEREKKNQQERWIEFMCRTFDTFSRTRDILELQTNTQNSTLSHNSG